MATAKHHQPGTVRTGGRTERTRQAVFAAALEELRQRGYGGLSAARIAERAGVHRTTVHRRWPDLGALIVDALNDAASAEVHVPDTGNVREDLNGLLRSVAARIDGQDARAQIRALLSDATRSAEIRTITRQFWTQRFALGEALLAQAVDRGELRDDIDPATIFTTFIAPLYLRLLITDEPLDRQFIHDIVTLGLDGSRSGMSTPNDDR